jgi:hypothetical protein
MPLDASESQREPQPELKRTEPPRFYATSPGTRGFLLALALAFGLCPVASLSLALYGVVTANSNATYAGLFMAAMTGVLFLPIAWVSLRYPRLILNGEGIELQQFGWRLSSSWDNVASLAYGGQIGIVTRDPMKGSGAGRLAAFGNMTMEGAPFYMEEARRLIAERRYMPLDPCSYWLWRGDLGQELIKRAPWLEGDIARAISEHSQQRGLLNKLLAGPNGHSFTRRNLYVAAGVIALAIGLAVVGGRLGSVVETATAVLLGLVLAKFSIDNCMTSVGLLRRRQYAGGLVWGALGLVTLLIVLAIAGSLIKVRG